MQTMARMLILIAGLLVGPVIAAQTTASQIAELEAQLGRDPAAVLAALAPLRSVPGSSIEASAELYLLASEAQALLVRGREALNEAEAGLALLPLPSQPDSMALAPLSVRLQLARAMALDLLGQSATALPPLRHLVEQLQAQGGDRQLLVETLTARGNLLLSLDDLAPALTDLQRAYSLATEQHPRVARGDIASVIANLYSEQADLENALRYYREAVSHFQQTRADIKLSIVVYGIGMLYRDQKNWPEARRHFGWSLELSRQRDDKQGVAYAEQQLAGVAIVTGQLTEARHLLDASQPLFEQAEDHAMAITSVLTRADLATAEKRYVDAMHLLQNAETQAKHQDFYWLEPRIWQRRAELHALQQRYEKAYEAYRTFHREHEAVFRRESDRQLQELRVRFDSERQEQQNTLLRQQNNLQEATLQQQRQQLWLYVAVAMLSLLSTIFLLYVLYKGRQLRQKLDDLAHTDELTGLPNRRHLMQEAQVEVERARRYQLPLCLAVMDLDHFKQINDQFGHGNGDEVLRQFAHICRQSLRQTDLIGRIGGEEFCLLLPHTESMLAEQTLERLRQDFKQAEWPQFAGKHQPTVSIGLTALCVADVGLAELMRRADEALYRAKQAGRDRVMVNAGGSAVVAAAATAG